MAKITAVEGGGDWADASVEYLVLPEGCDATQALEDWRIWYNKQYKPAFREGKKPKYLTFVEWLIAEGAREPTDEELEVVSDT